LMPVMARNLSMMGTTITLRAIAKEVVGDVKAVPNAEAQAKRFWVTKRPMRAAPQDAIVVWIPFGHQGGL
jgi:hypothetical protein